MDKHIEKTDCEKFKPTVQHPSHSCTLCGKDLDSFWHTHRVKCAVENIEVMEKLDIYYCEDCYNKWMRNPMAALVSSMKLFITLHNSVVKVTGKGNEIE